MKKLLILLAIMLQFSCATTKNYVAQWEKDTYMKETSFQDIDWNWMNLFNSECDHLYAIPYGFEGTWLYSRIEGTLCCMEYGHSRGCVLSPETIGKMIDLYEQEVNKW